MKTIASVLYSAIAGSRKLTSHHHVVKRALASLEGECTGHASRLQLRSFRVCGVCRMRVTEAMRKK